MRYIVTDPSLIKSGFYGKSVFRTFKEAAAYARMFPGRVVASLKERQA